MYVALCLFHDQFSHIKPVEQALEGKVRFVYTEHWNLDEIEKVGPHIIIGINEHYSGVAECYAYAQTKGIPTLTLQDGILEWRHMFKNPLYDGHTGPPLHAPVLANKIACIGLTSAMFIGHLGNWQKVELTGMPKLDVLKHSSSSIFNKSGRTVANVLILTSSKPWFNDDQREVVLRQLFDLKDYLSKREDIKVVWRVTKDLPKILGIENHYLEKSTIELSALIEEADAVITTISTTILEAQLLERPIATIDYFNTPTFVGSRWSIRHSSQIDSVINELLNPTKLDKTIQDFFLQQNLYIGSNAAAQTTSSLVLSMIEYSKKNPANILPANLLKKSFFPQFLRVDVEENTDKERMITKENSILWLETVRRLKYENQFLQDQLKQRSLTGFLINVIKSFVKEMRIKNK